jgi:hypothetical protein
MTVLRLPPAFPPHFVASVRQYHQPPLLFVSPIRLRKGQIQTGQDVPGPPPMATLSPSRLGGAVRASQVPGESSHAFALLSDPGRACLAMPLPQSGVAPVHRRTKAAAFNRFSRLYHTASALAVYASSLGFPTLARLASGGRQPLSGWDLNPLDSKANFMYGGYPILSQRSRLGLAPSVPLW